MADDLHPAEAAYMAAIRAGTDWYAAADKAVATLAKSRQPFTADDVRDACGLEPDNPNSWGGLFHYWRSRGLIRRVGFTSSRSKARNHAAIGVWQGTNPEA
ncbi:hypothetical protein GWO63_010065 [Corynebacterium macginleyi]|uniref:MarR family transcriptional regulator n=1 Tax=Corynebacterium macginleyi TaxID=38290 RepID=A0ABS1Y876_9CORY|nr:hypothetical protein [Corynebacterium macginleyi]MBM0244572.1 hypothetical protein [Corynebacterium macginleyi]